MSVFRTCSCRFFFFKQKTAYEMRISDWSSDVCSSDLLTPHIGVHRRIKLRLHANQTDIGFQGARCSAHARKEPTAADGNDQRVDLRRVLRSEEHTSELQSLMRISYAVFCLKKKKTEQDIMKHTVINPLDHNKYN